MGSHRLALHSTNLNRILFEVQCSIQAKCRSIESKREKLSWRWTEHQRFAVYDCDLLWTMLIVLSSGLGWSKAELGQIGLVQLHTITHVTISFKTILFKSLFIENVSWKHVILVRFLSTSCSRKFMLNWYLNAWYNSLNRDTWFPQSNSQYSCRELKMSMKKTICFGIKAK